jgi:nucleoside-diphosphate-sugar epimerase
MFPVDLVVWLLKSILDPRDVNMNVGSEDSISMFDLAAMISNLTHKKGVVILNPETPPNNYVPKTEIFRSIYNVKETVTLEAGLISWLAYLLRQKSK